LIKGPREEAEAAAYVVVRDRKKNLAGPPGVTEPRTGMHA
jgi:hypothetical protein